MPRGAPGGVPGVYRRQAAIRRASFGRGKAPLLRAPDISPLKGRRQLAIVVLKLLLLHAMALRRDGRYLLLRVSLEGVTGGCEIVYGAFFPPFFVCVCFRFVDDLNKVAAENRLHAGANPFARQLNRLFLINWSEM